MMNICTYSSLYPNCIKPQFGIFVENRLRHLLSTGVVSSRVVAPIPRFPLQFLGFSSYGKLSAVPSETIRNGIQVSHPRFPVFPGISWRIAPHLLASSTFATVKALHQSQPIDLIDAHYVYPDGIAAVMIGRKLGVPVTMTARGTDISLMPNFALPNRYIKWGLAKCDAAIAVCKALKDEMVSLGTVEDKVTVIRNGVDLETFVPLNRERSRKELGMTGRPTLLSVGYLIERKGHHLIIEALKELEEFELWIVGEGPYKSQLVQLANRLDVTDRVRFVGQLPQEQLPKYYSACDAMVLASDREGWANVLLESMACGTPVVATKIWGTPEVVGPDSDGVLFEDRTPQGVAAAVKHLWKHRPMAENVRKYAEQFNWQDVSAAQIQLFRQLVK